MSRRPMDATILERAQIAGKQGFGVADMLFIVNYPDHSIDHAARRLVKEGRLFRGKLGHRTMRFFAQAKWAEDYEAHHTLRPVLRRKAQGEPGNSHPSTWRNPQRAPWPADADTVFPTDEAGNPLYTVTVCPSFDSTSSRGPIRTNTHSDLY